MREALERLRRTRLLPSQEHRPALCKTRRPDEEMEAAVEGSTIETVDPEWRDLYPTLV